MKNMMGKTLEFGHMHENNIFYIFKKMWADCPALMAGRPIIWDWIDSLLCVGWASGLGGLTPHLS